jgi:hypothetical protein
MAKIDRTRPPGRLALYVALVAAWAGFARWVVPPLLIAEAPGRLLSGVNRYLHGFVTPFTGTDRLGRWFELSAAVGIAAFLHLSILEILRRYDLRAAREGSGDDLRAARRVSRVLSAFAAAFLAVAVLCWPRHDYYYFLQIWYEVRQGHDPWWIVHGRHGDGPLNAYGPAFNLLAVLPWLNPLLPRLLFAYAYVLFAVALTKEATAGRPASALRAPALFALFWNPFPWVEIPIRGHFDILVGLLCLAAVHARLRGRDILSGGCLALGVLLKYFPIVLLPFFMPDRGRLRLRIPLVAATLIGGGLALSYGLWGPSTFRPLSFAANRPSTTMSIFWFIRGSYSPLRRMGIATNFDYLSPVILTLALLLSWSWTRRRSPNPEAVAAVVAATTVLLYRVGFAQYQMVPFILASSWAIRNWGQLRCRTLLRVAIACQVAWLAAFDLCDALFDETTPVPLWGIQQDGAGLPTFLLGCLFLMGIVRAATPDDPGAAG